MTAMDLASDESVKAILQEALDGPKQEEVEGSEALAFIQMHCMQSALCTTWLISQNWKQVLSDTLWPLQAAGPSERLSEGVEHAQNAEAPQSEDDAAEQSAVSIGPQEQPKPMEKKERGNMRKRSGSHGEILVFCAHCLYWLYVTRLFSTV